MAAKAKKIFLIIDGHAVLHRAWHALPSMTSSEGVEVRGAYGFTTILLGAIKEFSPAYVAVTVDLEGPTFRHDRYEHYKATREKKPDELYQQIDHIREILAAMRIPVFSADGFEADDVIGTLSKLAPGLDPSIETIIATGDQDAFQLIDKRTKVYMPRRRDGKTVMTLLGEDDIKTEFGFAPRTLIDYKALRGDTSDNIPGVKGIGEVGAKKLIADFGSVPAIYEALDEDTRKDSKKAKAISEKTRALLLASKKDALSALDLCEIRRDVKLEFSLEMCAFSQASREQVAPVFTKLGFMRLLQQFPASAAPAPSNATASLFGEAAPAKDAPAAWIDVRDVEALSKALAAITKSVKVAFRFMTDADPYEPKPEALAVSDGKKRWIVHRAAIASGAPLLAGFFASKHEKVCHDLKHELKTLAGMKIAPKGPFFDLMIASYLLQSGERRHAIDSLLAYQRGVSFDEKPPDTPEARTERLAGEIEHLLPLEDAFRKQLEENDLVKLNDDIGLPLASVLAKMERTGVAVEKGYYETLSKELAKRIAKLTAKIHGFAGEEFNINSPAQLKTVLFDKLEISSLGLKKTAKGKTLSTAASELEKLRGSHEIIGDILDYREVTKLKSTYVDALPTLVHPKTGRIHAEFNQTVAATGRLSSSNPNLQNIPTPETEYGKKVRNGFVAPKGKLLISADYSQFELRIVAHIAKEKVMIDAFKKGEDIHWRTAAEMFGEKEAADRRRIAKVINFGILYGMGPQRLAESAEIPFMDAKDYIDRYFALHKGIAKYVEETKEKIADTGYVETLFGRKRFFRNVRLMNPRERAEAERQAINMPIQGSQADMIQLAMIKVDQHLAEKYPKGEVKMISQVHDELLFEVEKGAVEGFIPDMERIMTETVKLIVPVVVNVSVGARWGEMEKRNSQVF